MASVHKSTDSSHDVYPAHVPGMTQEGDRELVDAVAQLTYVNPFVPERVQLERQALGDDFVDGAEVWHYDAELGPNPNHLEIERRVDRLLPEMRRQLENATEDREADRRLYRDVALYSLYNRFQARLLEIVLADGKGRRRAAFYPEFEQQFHELFPEELKLPEVPEPALFFAWFFQVRRAFHSIFRSIVGGSMPAAELRAAIWQSIFSHDMRRFRRGLYRRMGEAATLITGPSGTGKELVARAIGLSRFIPFDPGRLDFDEDFHEAFFALNLAALSPTLIESELFGHKRGAFTGALSDRTGWFEICPPLGAVFLDEIGEVDESIQVKLLRVLETRTFQRIGELEDRFFRGKLIAATNREPSRAMSSGQMREDFFYRLCSDRIETPALHRQLADAPEELPRIVHAVTSRIVDPPEVEELAADVLRWIEREIGPDYAWPGNFRELEQCARNVMIRGEYRVPEIAGGSHLGSESQGDGLQTQLFGPMRRGDLDAEAVLSRYVTWVYSRTGSYLGAADRLGLDRRTVKAKIDEAWLRQLTGAEPDDDD